MKGGKIVVSQPLSGLVPSVGFEPTAYGLEDRCSFQLNYKDILVVVLGIEPRIEESKSSVLPLHYTTMLVPLVGLEPLTFWLTARRSTIELPRNIKACPNWETLK